MTGNQLFSDIRSGLDGAYTSALMLDKDSRCEEFVEVLGGRSEAVASIDFLIEEINRIGYVLTQIKERIE